MPNKKLLILLGVSLIVLLGSVIYREIQKEDVSPEVVPEEEVLDVIETVITEEEEETEKIKSLFDSAEEKFYTLTGNVFLLGDKEVERLEEDLLQIEEKINNTREEIYKEDADNDKIYKHLSEVQEMIEQLSEKLVEIEEE